MECVEDLRPKDHKGGILPLQANPKRKQGEHFLDKSSQIC